jgi:hypothetical protein
LKSNVGVFSVHAGLCVYVCFETFYINPV